MALFFSYSVLAITDVSVASTKTAKIAFFSKIEGDGVHYLTTLTLVEPATREEISSEIEGMIEPTHLFWSPSYDALGFSYAQSGNHDYSLATYHPATNTLNLIVSLPGVDIFNGAFSPSGTHMIYTTGSIYGQTPSSQLYLFNIADKMSSQIGRDIHIMDAYWLQNVIAINGFTDQDQDGFPLSDIYLFDTQTQQAVNITRSDSDEYFSDGSASQIAYISDETGQNQVFITDRTGRGKRQITHTSHDVFAPQWIGNSHLVYLISKRDAAKLILTDINTLQEQTLIETGYIDAFTLSPDQDQIAYSSRQTRSSPAKLCVYTIKTSEEWCARTAPRSDSAIAWS
jgi:dipeptidyl aminopeptidase/acylaminoacyl peptidase